MKYADASALLRILFGEPGPSLPLSASESVVSSRIVEIETYRAVDRERLLGNLDDQTTAVKRKELADLLGMLDLASVDDLVIERARGSFAVNVRALDAIHVATAEVLVAESGDEPLEFWTHDERQAAAALSRGLNVFGFE
jgi:predicted nucleic acid-binding protein